jgi:quinoprotein glucose dehydrogenase
MYTPPTLEGTVVMPGAIGGSGWGGASIDPATGWAYVKATNSPALYALKKQDVPNDTIATPYMVDLLHSSLGVAFREGPEGTSRPTGRLPVIKPPYGTLTAIDLNTGDTKWHIPLGDSPDVRNNPALRGVTLPDKLGVAGSPGCLVTAGGLLFTTGGGRVLYALDSKTGATLWEHDLGQIGYSNPMTYRTTSGKQYVVIATGIGANAKLVAFALPST